MSRGNIKNIRIFSFCERENPETRHDPALLREEFNVYTGGKPLHAEVRLNSFLSSAIMRSRTSGSHSFEWG